jgi:hypothetical protein
MPWFTRFDVPIKMTGRASLKTLAEARGYIIELGGPGRELIEWRTAMGLLSEAATHGEPYISMARLAFSRALRKKTDGGRERDRNSSRR